MVAMKVASMVVWKVVMMEVLKVVLTVGWTVQIVVDLSGEN